MVWLGFSMVALAAALIWSGVRTVNRGIEQERAAHGGIREAAQPDLGTAIWETIKKMFAILMDKDSPSWKRTMAWGAVQLWRWGRRCGRRSGSWLDNTARLDSIKLERDTSSRGLGSSGRPQTVAFRPPFATDALAYQPCVGRDSAPTGRASVTSAADCGYCLSVGTRAHS